MASCVHEHNFKYPLLLGFSADLLYLSWILLPLQGIFLVDALQNYGKALAASREPDLRAVFTVVSLWFNNQTSAAVNEAMEHIIRTVRCNFQRCMRGGVWRGRETDDGARRNGYGTVPRDVMWCSRVCCRVRGIRRVEWWMQRSILRPKHLSCRFLTAIYGLPSINYPLFAANYCW